jgi:hypothetical protein
VRTQPPFNELGQRYKQALDCRRELEQLDRQFRPQGQLSDVVDLAHFSVALRDVVLVEGVKRPVWANESHDLSVEAWQYALCKREGGCRAPVAYLAADREVHIPSESDVAAGSAGGAVQVTADREYNPHFNEAVPGNTARQRLAMAGRTTRPNVQQQQACSAIESELESERTFWAGYNNQDLVDYAKDHGFDWEEYNQAVYNLVKQIFDAGGLQNFDFNSLTPDDINDLFRSIPTPPGGTSISVPMGTDMSSGEIVYNRGTYSQPDYLVIVDPSGQVQQGNLNAARNHFRLLNSQMGSAAVDAYFDAILAHELVHQHNWRQSQGQTKDPESHSKDEQQAYEESMRKKQEWLQQNGC